MVRASEIGSDTEDYKEFFVYFFLNLLFMLLEKALVQSKKKLTMLKLMLLAM